jgi:chromosome segregation ATPase
MSLPKELQELQDKRAKLEDESHFLKDEQKKFEERAKALEQKIIEELRSKNEEARQNISHLDSTINDLEQRLGQITQETTTNEPIDETASQTPNLEATEGASVEINRAVLEDTAEDSAAVMSVNDSSSAVEKWNSESHQSNKKKKHKFWETHGY